MPRNVCRKWSLPVRRLSRYCEMKNKKIKKTYIDYGFGLPVQIINASLKKIRGEWVLDINFEKYERAVLLALAMKPGCLSGNEGKFRRNHFEMDLKKFGSRFGDIAHSAVIKREKCGDNITKIRGAIEKDIRLAIVNSISPNFFHQAYPMRICKQLCQTIKINFSELKAA